MKNKSEEDDNNKCKMRIYEDQTQLQQFVEPEWMKILRAILEQNQQTKTIKTINPSKNYDKRY